MARIMGLAGNHLLQQRKRELGMAEVANTEKAAAARADLKVAAFRVLEG